MSDTETAQSVPTVTVETDAAVTTTDYTNIQLEQLMSSNRILLAEAKAEAEALDAALTQQITDTKAKLDAAFAAEREEEATLVAQKQSFDDAILDARMGQLSATEIDFDTSMTEYEKKVLSNNVLASDVLNCFNANISKISEVQTKMKALKGKLDRVSALIDACNGKN